MQYFVALFLLLSITSVAQINFEPGYFIDRQNKRVDCLIRNEEWLRSPSSIKYKVDSTSDPVDLDVSALSEFSVSTFKYICATVKVDTSSQDDRYLTDSRTPRWAFKYLALRTLIAGKANLYQYDNGSILLYFFNVDSSTIEQLEYKVYGYVDPLETHRVRIVENMNYINQLKAQVSCGEEASKYANNKMKYNEDFLVNYFLRYNKCSGVESISYQRAKSQKTKVIPPEAYPWT